MAFDISAQLEERRAALATLDREREDRIVAAEHHYAVAAQVHLDEFDRLHRFEAELGFRITSGATSSAVPMSDAPARASASSSGQGFLLLAPPALKVMRTISTQTE